MEWVLSPSYCSPCCILDDLEDIKEAGQPVKGELRWSSLEEKAAWAVFFYYYYQMLSILTKRIPPLNSEQISNRKTNQINRKQNVHAESTTTKFRITTREDIDGTYMVRDLIPHVQRRMEAFNMLILERHNMCKVLCDCRIEVMLC